MKKFFLISALMLAASTVRAAVTEMPLPVNVSSYTATAETKARLGTTKPGDVLESVVIGKGSSGGTLTIYDGQGTNATATMFNIDLTTAQTHNFYVKVSSGITYTTASNTNGVTMIYRQR